MNEFGYKGKNIFYKKHEMMRFFLIERINQ